MLASDPSSPPSSSQEVALLGLQELEGSEERARAVLQAMVGAKCEPNPVGGVAGTLGDLEVVQLSVSYGKYSLS